MIQQVQLNSHPLKLIVIDVSGRGNVEHYGGGAGYTSLHRITAGRVRSKHVCWNLASESLLRRPLLLSACICFSLGWFYVDLLMYIFWPLFKGATIPYDKWH